MVFFRSFGVAAVLLLFNTAGAQTIPPELPPDECYLCGVGVDFGAPDKVLQGPGLDPISCGDFQQLLLNQRDVDLCLGAVDDNGYNGIDVRVYCECPGFDYVEGCGDLCPDSALINLGLNVSGIQCQEWQNLSRSVLDPELCENEILFEVRFACCEPIPECYVCDPDTPIPEPSKLIPFEDEGQQLTVNCSDLEFFTLAAGSKALCVDVLDTDFDIRAFCGCPAVEYPESCGTLCADFGSEIVDPGLVVDSITCSEWGDLYRSVSNEAICEEGTDTVETRIRQQCCSEFPVCHICDNQAPVGAPDKLLYLNGSPFEGATITCQQLEDQLVADNNLQVCLDAFDRGGYGGIDLPTYCQCPSFDLPTENCGVLCPDDFGITEPDKTFQELSCKEWNEMAQSVADDTLCSDFDAARTACCVETFTCSVCPDGQLRRPDQKLRVDSKVYTCEEFEKKLQEDGDLDKCKRVQDPNGYDNIDVQWLCRCNDASEPRICRDGICPGDLAILDFGKEVNGMTCEDWDRYVLAATNEDFCEQGDNGYLDGIRNSCCYNAFESDGGF
jgi:hypothetical protein